MEINGKELNFSLFDADNAEMKKRYFEKLKEMAHVRDALPDGTEQEKNKYLCDRIKDMFDYVFGEGVGASVCGRGNDLLVHLEAYDQLVSEQIRQQERYQQVMSKLKGFKKKAGKK